ncbi:hydrogenase maturation protein HypF [Catenibacillus scindens]|uniref:Carbamoyltransferase n=1 Tax=Catenibacillus scindens TaxID=673271 RepID=A0A7W8H888_9FIRM|nr:carbamoyltransferase HypF [Catenibacillus scindens]MBB5263548.1 hydrogenase maturation protein HypF [Catenibacillus scindens]
MKKRISFTIEGVVQGVGFRPFLHRLARRFSLGGWAKNTSGGVCGELEGKADDLSFFFEALPSCLPPLARIENIEKKELQSLEGYSDFKILDSDVGDGFTLISPDMATCMDCERELLNPADRRYLYPFINCTNCGPRFTIIRRMPYDRKNTSMAPFPMCPVCAREYGDIDNRRYHAQPDCCPDCGPEVFFLDSQGNRLPGSALDDPISHARRYLAQGKIIAVKGIGGIHLACNALDPQAVARLRQKKGRPRKPLALMAASTEAVRSICRLSPEEELLLTSESRPIVLLEKRVPDILPNISFCGSIGVMLPYTPVHRLLFHGSNMKLLVMTSANRSGCPVLTDNDESLHTLSGVADGFLLNNRDIVNRCDDSVVMYGHKGPVFFRRSRGYAPAPFYSPKDFTGICAFGAEQKAAFAFGRGPYLFLSPHIGDLKNMETMDHYESMAKTYNELFKIHPEIIACDLHPDYASTHIAEKAAKEAGRPLIRVQHHHGHMAACMADNGLDEEVFAIIWDGTGLGSDREIWGGEFLTGDFKNCKRVGSIRPIALPGGDKATEEIGRIGLSLLWDAGLDTDFAPLFVKKRQAVTALLDHHLSCPAASSMGRLFDGVAALLCSLNGITFDGEGPMSVEALASGCMPDLSKDCPPYPALFYSDAGVRRFDIRPLVRAIVSDIKHKVKSDAIAKKFMETLCYMALFQTQALNPRHLPVVLSGGVFLNRFLLSGVTELLARHSFKVYTHHKVSPTDEGLALGQAFIALYTSSTTRKEV